MSVLTFQKVKSEPLPRRGATSKWSRRRLNRPAATPQGDSNVAIWKILIFLSCGNFIEFIIGVNVMYGRGKLIEIGFCKYVCFMSLMRVVFLLWFWCKIWFFYYETILMGILQEWWPTITKMTQTSCFKIIRGLNDG